MTQTIISHISKENWSAPFKGRSLLTWANWTPQEILQVLSLAQTVKKQAKAGEIHSRFLGKSIALIFEKRSTRTRSAFETAFAEEAGHPVFMSTQDIQLGGKESIEDTARVLGRMFSAIEFRGFKQEHVEALAKYSGVPVINGLTDSFHPTQALADIMTLKENFGKLKGLHLAFFGDGRNNVVRSLLVICSKLGVDLSIVSPRELFPDDDILQMCKPFAKENGAKICVTSDIFLVKNANCVYTDVWVSMGEEALKDARTKLLRPYQVNQDLMSSVGDKKTIFLHCLPAIKEQEVTKQVFESPASKVWDQAENRKHTIKAIMLSLI